MNNKGLFGWLFFIVIIGVIFYFAYNGIPINEVINGQHTGTITAIEDSGIFFKTTTVYFKTDTQSSQEDTYCLKDKSLRNELEELSKNKTKITLTYYSDFYNGFKNCNGEFAVISGIKW